MIKKIFISGPMTGIEKYNFPKFDKTEKMLSRYYGYKVVNPAKIARKYKVKDVLEHREVFDKMVNEELDALETVEIAMSKAKTNIAQLEATQTVVVNLKAVNETLATINGVGTDDTQIGLNVEKLNDDLTRAEAENSIYSSAKSSKMTEEEAKAFLENLD